MRHFLPRHFAVTLLLLGAFLIGCGSPGSNRGGATAGTRGGTLNYRLTTAPNTFNYVMAADEPTIITAFFLLHGRLVDFDQRTQTYVPGLAESWTTADGGLTVNVKLRDGLKFSNGSDITSDDVVFTFDAIYDERTKSPAWRDAMTIGGKPMKVRAVDKLSIELTLPERVAAIENYLVNLAVLPAAVLRPELDAGRFAEAWKIDTAPEKIVSSGPFVVESAVAGETITFARNAHYGKKGSDGAALPYLDKIVIHVVADANNAMARLGQNTLDIVDRLRPADYATLAGTPGPVKAVDVGPGLATDHLWFNLSDATAAGVRLDAAPKFRWFSDRRFRQAVSAAIDRQTIANTTLRGLATPMRGFVSPGNRTWLSKELPAIEYNLEKARQLLTEAGFEKRGPADAPELFDSKGERVEFTLLVPTENEPRKLMAAVIQEDLAKLGIKMQVVPLENSKVSTFWRSSLDYDAVLLGLSQTDTEPSSFANFLLSKAATHQWRPNQKAPATEWEARIDKLFAEQAGEPDAARRAAIFNEIQKIMADEVPVIPLVARHVVSAANARVGNFVPGPIMPYSLWNADELFVSK